MGALAHRIVRVASAGRVSGRLDADDCPASCRGLVRDCRRLAWVDEQEESAARLMRQQVAHPVDRRVIGRVVAEVEVVDQELESRGSPRHPAQASKDEVVCQAAGWEAQKGVLPQVPAARG